MPLNDVGRYERDGELVVHIESPDSTPDHFVVVENWSKKAKEHGNELCFMQGDGQEEVAMSVSIESAIAVRDGIEAWLWQHGHEELPKHQ